jgi:hypothetical protein
MTAVDRLAVKLARNVRVRGHVRMQDGELVKVKGHLRKAFGRYPSLINNPGDHMVLTRHKVPKKVLDWMTKNNMRFAIADDPTLDNSIFGMSKAQYRPALRQVTLWVHPEHRPGWVNAALAHEVGHAIALDQVYDQTGDRGVADAHTEEYAWEKGREWAEEMGIPLDNDSRLLEDVAIGILHQEGL